MKERPLMQPQVPFEIPQALKDLTAKNLEEGKKAVQEFLLSAGKAMQGFEASAGDLQGTTKDIHQAALGYAQDQVQLSLGFAEAIMNAKNPNEIINLQKDFVQDQMTRFQEQSQEMGQLITNAITQWGQAFKK